MKRHQLILIASLTLGPLSCSNAPPSTETTAIEKKANYISTVNNPRPNIYSGGQPSQEQLKQLADTGVKHIINLRPAAEMSWDEEVAASKLGLQYHSIPVAGAAGVTQENARKLRTTLNELTGEKIYIHCASGNRVGALIALDAVATDGKDIESAVLEGKQWGLTKLEGKVRQTVKGE